MPLVGWFRDVVGRIATSCCPINESGSTTRETPCCGVVRSKPSLDQLEWLGVMSGISSDYRMLAKKKTRWCTAGRDSVAGTE